MRILNIIPYKVFPAHLGGEKAVVLFNEYMGKKTEVFAVTVRSNDPGYAKYFKVFNILSDSRIRYANPFLYFKIKKLIHRYQITHLATEHPYFGWLAWLLKLTTGVQYLVRSHNIEYQRSASIGRKWWKLLKVYESWVYRKADWVFFISEDDRKLALEDKKLDPNKTFVLPYGITNRLNKEEIPEAQEVIRKKHHIPSDKKILLFNGALYHHTNYDALRIILEQINPILLQEHSDRYVIIVCGKGLPASFNELKQYSGRNVIYAGFVEDISLYFKAADIFLNPIMAGGGVKTKAIEAIGYNCTVISSPLGAMGIERGVCGEKLIVAENNNWKDFAEKVIFELGKQSDTPESFYDYYNWESVTENVIKILSQQDA